MSSEAPAGARRALAPGRDDGADRGQGQDHQTADEHLKTVFTQVAHHRAQP